MAKKPKHRKRAIEDSIDDGVIEKPEFDCSATQCGRIQMKVPNYSRPPSCGRLPVSSSFREGQVVNCPDKSKLGNTSARTGGTIVHLFASSCLVLGHDGLIHLCFITELT